MDLSNLSATLGPRHVIQKLKAFKICVIETFPRSGITMLHHHHDQHHHQQQHDTHKNAVCFLRPEQLYSPKL